MPSALISAAELEQRLGDGSLAVLEVSFAESDDGYRAGHVPGAARAYWKDLLWHETDRSFAPPEELGRRLGALGLGSGTTVVLAGDPVQFGTYAFWALASAGFDRLLVLDGGKEHWLLAGHPVSTEPVTRAPTAARAPARPPSSAAVVGRDEVLAAVAAGTPAILDFRSPEEYRGERVSPEHMGPVDHGAERKGRIPGARHLYYRDLLEEDWTLRAPEEIEATLREIGVGSDGEVIGYCRLSHRASLGWFAFTQLLGMERVRVYDGSWTEWGSMVGMPVERDG